MIETLQTLQITNQVAVLVLRTLTDSLDHGNLRTPLRAVARTQLLLDNATLRVDLLGVERNEVRPVVQNHQRRIHNALACYGHIGHIVLRVVPRSTCIEVGTELNADLLQILDQRLAGVVLRTVEGHVLKEVSQTLLVVILLDGTHIVQDVELGHTLGFLVVTDVVGKSVLQHTLAHGGIGGKLLIHLRLRGESYAHHKGHNHKNKSLHISYLIAVIFTLVLGFLVYARTCDQAHQHT